MNIYLDLFLTFLKVCILFIHLYYNIIIISIQYFWFFRIFLFLKQQKALCNLYTTPQRPLLFNYNNWQFGFFDHRFTDTAF